MKKIILFILLILGLICFCACSSIDNSKNETSTGVSDNYVAQDKSPEEFFDMMDDVTSVNMQFKKDSEADTETEVDIKIIDILLNSEFIELETSNKYAMSESPVYVINFIDEYGRALYEMKYYPENIKSEDEMEAFFIEDFGEISFFNEYRIKNIELVEFLKEYESKVD